MHGTGASRLEPLATFFKGPGETTLQSGDIITALQLPVPPADFVGTYKKLNRNQRGDLAIVGVTACSYPNADIPSGRTVRVALASVAPTPLVVPEIAKYFNDHDLTEENIQEAAKIAREACRPIDDVRGSARYRQMMVRNLTRQALITLQANL